MGERKDQQIIVRMMLPMSIRCNTCRSCIYGGTVLNSRKEGAIGEAYLGIQIFRYYFKCTLCYAKITMKTFPQNSDYVVESGAVRSFEPWHDEEATVREKIRREAKEMRDAMKSVEKWAMDSKQDMVILVAHEEMKSMTSRHATVSVEDTLTALKHSSYEKDKSTSVLPSVVEKPTDTLTKARIFNSSKSGDELYACDIEVLPDGVGDQTF